MKTKLLLIFLLTIWTLSCKDKKKENITENQEWVGTVLSVGIDEQAQTYLLSDSIGRTLELKKEDVKLRNDSIYFRLGAKPVKVNQNAELSEPNTAPLNSSCSPDPSCNGQGENGCTYCIALAMFCCGGGLKGICLGAWSC